MSDIPTDTTTMEAAAPSGSVIRDKANVIARALATTHKMQAAVVAGPFLDLLQQLLGTLLPMLQNCLHPAATATEVHAAMTKLTWLQHLFINREVRKALGTIRAYREMGQALHDEIVKAAAAATPEETAAAMDEAASL